MSALVAGDEVITEDFRIQLVRVPLRHVPPGCVMTVLRSRWFSGMVHAHGLAIDDRLRLGDWVELVMYRPDVWGD